MGTNPQQNRSQVWDTLICLNSFTENIITLMEIPEHLQQHLQHLPQHLQPRNITQHFHRETEFYNMETETWTKGPDMSRSRRFHTCNLVTHIDRTSDIVIIGGENDDTCNRDNVVDIIHLGCDTQTRQG